ncbi:MAG: type II secretion system protein [Candidatus Paceibacterota bacterium]
MTKQEQLKGFTLLELLIVIAILSILAMALILVLNPAETMKKSRDTQRMTDLSTVKTAIGLYLTNSTTPAMDMGSNGSCKVGATWVGEESSGKIYYSVPSDTTDISDMILDGTTFTGTAGAGQVTAANIGLTTGNGWIPVNISSLAGGSPISNFPVDPVNTVTAAGVANSDLVYRYACGDSLTYEIDAKLESTEFGAKAVSDGGNNPDLYETGTSLTILGGGTDF